MGWDGMVWNGMELLRQGMIDNTISDVIENHTPHLLVIQHPNKGLIVHKVIHVKLLLLNLAFNAETQLIYYLPENSHVQCDIFDINGRHITKLINGNMNAGKHTLKWHRRDSQGHAVASGIYLFMIKTESYQRTVKSLLIR